jgi:hypothetical protein
VASAAKGLWRMTVDIALYALLFFCLPWDEERKNIRLWSCLSPPPHC